MSEGEIYIREDLREDTEVPVRFLDLKEDAHVGHSDTLKVECLFSTDGEELYEGMGILVRITEPKRGWVERMAFAYSIDFDWEKPNTQED